MSGHLEFFSNKEAEAKIVSLSVVIGLVAYGAMKFVQKGSFGAVNNTLTHYNISPKDI